MVLDKRISLDPNAPDNLYTGAQKVNAALDEVAQRLEEVKYDGFASEEFLEMPEKYLEIPSAIGNSLTTHPSVVDFGEGNKWNGYRYWMAHTPYPGTQNENPSIAASNDNVTWLLPEGAPNPIIKAPAAPAYYSDTEMVYILESNKLRIYYREANTPSGAVVIWYIESNDGSVWTTPKISLSSTNWTILSPAIVRINDSSWFMYSVETQSTIHRRSSIDGIVWSNPDAITQPWKNWSAWHIGITLDEDGKYHMLGSTWADASSGEGTQYRPIVYASSPDGWNWVANEKPQLIPTGWAGGYLYRPHFIVDNSKGLSDGMPYVKVYFGAAGDAVASSWHIGFSEGYLMSGNTNPSATSEQVKRKRIGEYFKLFTSNIIAPFAKIGRLKTKRLEITSDYSQPLLEMRDGRVGRDGGNYLRQEYQGNQDPQNIRLHLTFTDDTGEYKRHSIAPFQNIISLQDGTKVGGIYEIVSSGDFKVTDLNTEGRFNLIRYSKLDDKLHFGAPLGETEIGLGIRLAKSTNKALYNRLVTDASGNLQIQLRAVDGKSYTLMLRSADGALDMGGGGIMNAAYISIGSATSITNAPKGGLFEDADGKLKYKNREGAVTILT